MDSSGALDELLAEQRAYYRHIAPNYERYALHDRGSGELFEAFDAFTPGAEVLELACGTGIWTERLLASGARVTAVDASAEMIDIAACRVGEGDRVRFLQADLFAWHPESSHSFDSVVFGFWLSHVPSDRFAGFWALVEQCLAEEGRVFFADDAHRGPEELAYGADSEVVRRQLRDGSVHRVVKVPHTAAGLQARLAELGWDFTVHQTRGPFYWAVGGRA